MKIHPSFEKHREAKSISRMLVASAMIAVATSAWGCSSRVDTSRVESFDDWGFQPLRVVPLLTRKYFRFIRSDRLCRFGGRFCSGAARIYRSPLGTCRAPLGWRR